MKRVIPIDHGNRLIKSERQVFPSSFMESKYLPSFGGDVLKYEGKTYALVDQNLPVLNDKTEDDRYFILSLFAIGKELDKEAEMLNKLTPHDHIKVELPIGLPLQHYETYKKKFEQYFNNRSGVIQYELNGKPYSIKITGAVAFPQAYSAAITVYDKLKDSNIVNIVDLGGFTVDCLQLNRFKPNMTLCTSLYWGVNTLFQSINDQMRSTSMPQTISTAVIIATKKAVWCSCTERCMAFPIRKRIGRYVKFWGAVKKLLSRKLTPKQNSQAAPTMKPCTKPTRCCFQCCLLPLPTRNIFCPEGCHKTRLADMAIKAYLPSDSRYCVQSWQKAVVFLKAYLVFIKITAYGM